MEQIRSFIAIELPDELKSKLGRLQTELKLDSLPWLKPVDPQSIHLTLKFLGNIAAGQVGAITSAIEVATQGISPFSLKASQLGVFPNPRRVQVAWVGLSGDTDKLARLQQQIEVNLSRLGFPAESRPFTAHLTLARARDRALPTERQRFGEIITGSRAEIHYIIEVTAISLMKSQLTRAGAIYSRISATEL